MHSRGANPLTRLPRCSASVPDVLPTSVRWISRTCSALVWLKKRRVAVDPAMLSGRSRGKNTGTRQSARRRSPTSERAHQILDNGFGDREHGGHYPGFAHGVDEPIVTDITHRNDGRRTPIERPPDCAGTGSGRDDGSGVDHNQWGATRKCWRADARVEVDERAIDGTNLATY